MKNVMALNLVEDMTLNSLSCGVYDNCNELELIVLHLFFVVYDNLLCNLSIYFWDNFI